MPKSTRKLALLGAFGGSLVPQPVDVALVLKRDSTFDCALGEVTAVPWNVVETDTIGELDSSSPTAIRMRRSGRRLIKLLISLTTQRPDVYLQVRKIDQAGAYTTLYRMDFDPATTISKELSSVFRAGEQLEVSISNESAALRTVDFVDGSEPVLEISLMARGGGA